jgi:cytochrome b
VKNEKSDNLSARGGNENQKLSIRVWDIPTRLFHWLLVGLVIFSLITGNIGLSAMKYHEWSGFAILVLIGFRLVWGLMGGQHSRFKSFVRGPKIVLRYASSLLKTVSEHHIGHNPLGGWSVVAMLISLLIQAGTGLFANDDIITEGPLYNWVSKETSDWLTSIHHVNIKVLIALIIIHICAIFFYLFAKRENLIKPMITGDKFWHQPLDSTRENPLRALILVATIAVIAYLLIY